MANNQGAGPRLPPAPMTVQSVGGMEKKRHSNSYFVVLFTFVKEMQEKDKQGGTKSHLWKKNKL